MAFFCPHLLIPKRLCNFSLPMALRTVPSQNGHLRDIPTKSHGPGIIIVKIPLIYHLVMTNSNSHGKSPFLSSVNHLFRLGPSIPWRTVSHNQRVIRVGDTAFIVFFYLPFFHAISMVDSTRRPPQQRLSRRDSARQTDGSPARPVGWNGRPMKNEQKRSATVGKCVLLQLGSSTAFFLRSDVQRSKKKHFYAGVCILCIIYHMCIYKHYKCMDEVNASSTLFLGRFHVEESLLAVSL